MCGIAGWIDWEYDLRDYPETIRKMGNTMTHRGPDADGSWISKSASFSHTRLIVIDPEGGSQPMIKQYGDKKYVIVYNGELYNTYELREKLIERGHKFNSHSDTEVLLVSYIEWGEKCVDYLNGIYAFGVWDESEQQLFLARDRLGVKPLFYAKRNKSILFASELKALLAHHYITPEVNREGLSEIFGLGPSRTPGHGVFNGISELRPGHYLIFNKSKTEIKQYWKLQSKEHEDDLDTTIEKVRTLVLDAIERQLISDVPVCTFLSGGLDSSIISAVASKIYKQRKKELHTYSIDYVGNKTNFIPNEFQPNSDEKWIYLMSEFINSTHHFIMVDTPDLADALKDAVIARDLPGMADIDSSLLLFSKQVKKGATVGLSGECADEIFGGYPWFYREQDLLSNTFPWLRSIQERNRILTDELKQKINIEEYVQERYFETLKEVPVLETDSSEQIRIRELFYLNMTWFMATLLERKDRMTMATGLEVRVPYADHRLIEYLWNVPWDMKNLAGREKGLLREAAKGLLPEEVLTRKKSPYPKTHNPVYAKIVSDEMMRIVRDNNSPILDLINKEKLINLAETQGKDFKVPWFGQLMTGPQLLAYLIQLNYWLEKYKVVIKL